MADGDDKCVRVHDELDACRRMGEALKNSVVQFDVWTGLFHVGPLILGLYAEVCPFCGGSLNG